LIEEAKIEGHKEIFDYLSIIDIIDDASNGEEAFKAIERSFLS